MKYEYMITMSVAYEAPEGNRETLTTSFLTSNKLLENINDINNIRTELTKRLNKDFNNTILGEPIIINIQRFPI